MKPELIVIAAVSVNNVIGKDGQIPWKIPEDLKRFKKLTSNHPVIMGRKTYESIPEKFRPLPDRINYIITQQIAYPAVGEAAGISVPVVSLDAALYCIDKKIPPVQTIDYSKAFVIGGEQVYREALSLADKIELTRVYKIIKDGDAFFSGFDFQEWRRTQLELRQGYCFVTYQRNKQNFMNGKR